METSTRSTNRIVAIATLFVCMISMVFADRIVFKTGKSREGTVLSENDTEVVFQDPTTGRVTFPRSSIQEIQRSNPLPGQTSSNVNVSAISAQVSAAIAVDKHKEAFDAIAKAVKENPALVPQLMRDYQKVVYDVLGKADKLKESNKPVARGHYYNAVLGLSIENAAALTGTADTHASLLQTAKSNLAELNYALAAQYRSGGDHKTASLLLKDSVRLDESNVNYRLALAEAAMANAEYQVAYQNFQAVSGMPASPEIKKRAFSGMQDAQQRSGNTIAQPTPTPQVPRPTAAPAVTPPPQMAAPQPQPTPAAPASTPPTGPAYKKLLWQVQNNEFVQSAKKYGSEVLTGEHLEIVLGIPAILLIGWILPYYFLAFKAKRGDIIAGQYRDSAKFLGLVAVLIWGVKSVKVGGGAPKNRCPFCNKGIDNIEQYSDLNFYTCPHCRENITPIYDLKDYVDHLIKQLGAPAKKKGIDTVEKDAMIKLVRGVLTLAVRRRASDLHVDSEVEGAKIRARIDGMMYDLMQLPRSITNAFVSAIKVMANLDITERRMPQDGSMSLWIDKTDVDLRINTSPTPMGEKVSIRILNQRQIQVDPTKLGLEGDNLEKYERSLRKPHGLIIVTGPSGSGKSTTLYVALNQLNSGDKNIVTIEDPIEYQVKGLSQMQVNPAANFTFATGLRSILRQDPDVIMVGEIRDSETAEIAVEAALTGHLVFTTLHTIDAPSAFNRLADLGVETRRLANAVICILAMRLIRTVCPECKKPYKPKKTDLDQLGLGNNKDMTFVHGAGCDNCLNTGYFGRIGIFEFLVPNENMREILETNAPVSVIREVAKQTGYRTLREEGILKISQGLTTVEEVIRVTT